MILRGVTVFVLAGATTLVAVANFWAAWMIGEGPCGAYPPVPETSSLGRFCALGQGEDPLSVLRTLVVIFGPTLLAVVGVVAFVISGRRRRWGGLLVLAAIWLVAFYALGTSLSS